MLRMCGLVTEEAMAFFKSLSSDCNDTLVGSLSDKDISIDDTPVSLSSFLRTLKMLINTLNSSDEDLEEQSISIVKKKRKTIAGIPGFPLNLRFDRLSISTRWCH
ncbi:hypothetical protein NPIL_319121 [Nephila pilipes]|uniref:Uncharacterized protein n=1 Tax=Nephila pilipes TaxID=299642 RepID=A0A8X6MVC2_NEPPI|nr:hypothetical protein NPIL_319121 [Nephila pilipes]